VPLPHAGLLRLHGRVLPRHELLSSSAELGKIVNRRLTGRRLSERRAPDREDRAHAALVCPGRRPVVTELHTRQVCGAENLRPVQLGNRATAPRLA